MSNLEYEEATFQRTTEGAAEIEPPPAGWPTIAAEAYHGLAGEVVRVIGPHTECDPIAILVHYLIFFGNAVGRGPYYQVEGDKHHTNAYVVLVGDTSKGRKGTSAGRVRQIFEIAEPDWVRERVASGLSTGEGLIWVVRDPISQWTKGADGAEPAEVTPASRTRDSWSLSPSLRAPSR
jgi:hypothetical protein